MNYSGIIPIIAGIGIVLWSATLFAKAETPIRLFEESTSLIRSRIYRVTRNPMYLGMVLILPGVALLLGSLSLFFLILLFAWLIQALFIVPEETMLEQRFGEEYLQFKASVRRWL